MWIQYGDAVGATDSDEAARYFKTKYNHVFTVEPAAKAKNAIAWVERILKEERDIVISSRALEATAFQIENIRMAYVFYASGLAINVMYTIDDIKKRAVGFKLSEGMEIPAELAPRFKFATQEVEVGWHRSRFVLCVQGRLLIRVESATSGRLKGKGTTSREGFGKHGSLVGCLAIPKFAGAAPRDITRSPDILALG